MIVNTTYIKNYFLNLKKLLNYLRELQVCKTKK